MQRELKEKWGRWLVTSLLASCLLVPATGGFAQKQSDKKAPARKESKESKERGKVRGRLPAYFSDIVSAEQREKIYSIQEQYAEQVKKLHEEISSLQAKQQSEIDAVLTADQLQKVSEMVAKAKSARKSEKTASEPTADDASN